MKSFKKLEIKWEMKSVTVMPNPNNTIQMSFCPTVREGKNVC